MVGNLAVLITCEKFRYDIFRGYDFTGVEFPIFIFIFAWALQQCSSIAVILDLIEVEVIMLQLLWQVVTSARQSCRGICKHTQYAVYVHFSLSYTRILTTVRQAASSDALSHSCNACHTSAMLQLPLHSLSVTSTDTRTDEERRPNYAKITKLHVAFDALPGIILSATGWWSRRAGTRLSCSSC